MNHHESINDKNRISIPMNFSIVNKNLCKTIISVEFEKLDNLLDSKYINTDNLFLSNHSIDY